MIAAPVKRVDAQPACPECWATDGMHEESCRLYKKMVQEAEKEVRKEKSK